MNTKYEFHTPVLIDEVIEGLRIIRGKRYIDATLGGGGHGLEIIRQGGILLGIDQDKEALEFARRKLEVGSGKLDSKNEKLDRAGNWKLVQGNFVDIKEIVEKEHFAPVAGILFDLGVSTFQIKQSGRGFSFVGNEPLDMRMNIGNSLTAYQVVNTFDYEQLIDILMRFGEEEKAVEIAQAIIETRKKQPIATTEALRAIVGNVVRHRGKTDPATKTFQAIRIAVNNELEVLSKTLPQAIDLLETDGRIAVISFHSLEDRIVKRLFMDRQLMLITKRPMIASFDEIAINRAARSAKLRIAQKLYEPSTT